MHWERIENIVGNRRGVRFPSGGGTNSTKSSSVSSCGLETIEYARSMSPVPMVQYCPALKEKSFGFSIHINQRSSEISFRSSIFVESFFGLAKRFFLTFLSIFYRSSLFLYISSMNYHSYLVNYNFKLGNFP